MRARGARRKKISRRLPGALRDATREPALLLTPKDGARQVEGRTGEPRHGGLRGLGRRGLVGGRRRRDEFFQVGHAGLAGGDGFLPKNLPADLMAQLREESARLERSVPWLIHMADRS